MQLINYERTAAKGKLLPQPRNRMLCPFIRKPFESCYCASTNSMYTEATIHYCGGNFERCEIYAKNAKSGEIKG